jgi:hypothetical protein
MNAASSIPSRLPDLPLWRLLVLLDDAEREAGPDSPTVKVIARIVKERLQNERSPASDADTARQDGSR